MTHKTYGFEFFYLDSGTDNFSVATVKKGKTKEVVLNCINILNILSDKKYIVCDLKFTLF